MKSFLNRQDELTRRAFVLRAAASMLGVAVPQVFGSRSALAGTAGAGKAEHVIYLYLSGGMSHLDTFDPKPGKSQMGPTEAIDTSVTGVKFAANVPELAKRANRIAVIRSLKSTQGAHELGNHYMHTGYVKRGTIVHPALGAWTSALKPRLNPTMPSNVVIAGGSSHPGAGFMDAVHGPIPIGDPEAGLQNSRPLPGLTEEDVEKRLGLIEQFDRQFHSEYAANSVRAYSDLYGEALKLMRSEDVEAFDLNKEPEAVRNRYGAPDADYDMDDRTATTLRKFGLGCLLARRLVERGVRFVEVGLGGWDTHVDNFERLPELAHVLDRAMSALIDDLQARGLFEKTLVVVATEFGRSPQINETDGRNHHPQAFSCVLAGGGVQGGQVYGATDDIGQEVAEDGVTVPDFNATIAYAQGLPLDKVLHSPSGRPFTVADKGKPVTALF